ncbi:ABC transporter-like, ATP-binding domain [Dillenia turbinata]|uniref:ABC transporter-like, ATP-binding domain n=1 Tax=Dillenia turbinata TaxID=194707 RepID=A0AAN8WHS1_9MAGN
MEKNMEDLEAQIDPEALAIFKEAKQPVTLKFEDVCYKIKIKETEKVILKGISGFVLPGEMLAMLGPSGSGKTTLLTALGGRHSSEQSSGTIAYNGKPYDKRMKRNTGFVTQDDILYPHLTVIETLVFAALLRLPNSFTKQEKVMHAEAVITQLGLTKCNPLYFGKGVTALDYFSSIGFALTVAMNPSDYLLDLANEVDLQEKAMQISGKICWLNPLSHLTFNFTSGQWQGISSDDSHGEDQINTKQRLVSAYKKNLENSLKAEIHEVGNNLEDNSDDKEFGLWATTWWQQFTILLRRGLKERRHESFSGLRVGEVLVVSFLVGLLWFKTKHIQDKAGLLFFYPSFWGVFPLFHAIFTFPPELMMIHKERTSRMYKLSSYFMSKIVGDLPMELILPTIFVIITYWMAWLRPTAGNFFYALAALLLTVLVAQGIGLALGAIVMDIKSASVLASVLMLAFQLAGGFLVQNVPSFIAWVKYISPNYYTYKLLLGSQFGPEDITGIPTIKGVGLGGQGVAAIALIIMIVFYRFIAYLALTRVGRTG